MYLCEKSRNFRNISFLICSQAKASNMRIILAHKFIKLTGGAEVFVQEAGRVLADNGHDVHYLATGSAEDVEWNDYITPDNVTLLEAPTYSGGSTLSKVQSIPRAVWSNYAKKETSKLIDQFQPDLMHAFAIHVHLSPSILKAAKEKNVATVMTCNDYKHLCGNYKLFHNGAICMDCKGGKFLSPIRNKCAQNSIAMSTVTALEAYVQNKLGVYKNLVDHYTFSADFMANLTQEFWSNDDFSWSKLLNPFDSNSFTSIDGDNGYGLYFGRIIDEKGVDRLVEAAKNIDNFPIKIVGTGPDEEMLRARVKDLGLTNVEFLGPLWNKELEPVLSQARFVVVPSVWHENFPYVINQSFALGRPVIGANRGGITELISHGKRGLVYDADDISALSTAIKRLANDQKEARAMGEAAKDWSDNVFTDIRFNNELNEAYHKAQNAHSCTRR